MDLCLGFMHSSESNYLRFPIWISGILSPNATISDLRELVSKINDPKNRLSKRDKFAALIASHSNLSDVRFDLFQSIKKLAKKLRIKSPYVHCAGRFLNNTDELNVKFNNDKLSFLRQFKFNICPENCSSHGYVTEKIFHSFISGCIPIYWGALNDPEPDLINQESIIFYNKQDDIGLENSAKSLKRLNNRGGGGGGKLIKIKTFYKKHSRNFFEKSKLEDIKLRQQISELMLDKQKYEEFCHILPLQNNADEIIYEKLMNLKTKLKELLA